MSAEASTLTEQASTALTLAERARNALGLIDVEQQLQALAARSATITEITNPAGRDQVHAARMALKAKRIEIEKVGKAARDDAQRFSKEVIVQENKLIALIEPEESRLQILQDAWDAAREEERKRKLDAERARVAVIQETIEQDLRCVPTHMVGQRAATLEVTIRDVVAIEITAERFAEFAPIATAVKESTLAKLREMHAKQVLHEAEQERLRLEGEELERKRAAQEEANRLERERIAADEAEAKRKVEAQKAIDDAERQAKIDAERARLRAERAENERIAREQKAQREREDAERAERQRQEDEARAAEQAKAQEALQRQQAELDAQKAEIERQQAELAKPPPAPVAANAQLADDFVLTYDVVEIPAAGDVYEPAALPQLEATDVGPTCAPRAHIKNEEAERMLAEAQLLLGIPVIFTRYELAALAASPDALQVLIDYHDYQSVCFEATDAADHCPFHDERSSELTMLRNLVAALRQKEIDG